MLTFKDHLFACHFNQNSEHKGVSSDIPSSPSMSFKCQPTRRCQVILKLVARSYKHQYCTTRELSAKQFKLIRCIVYDYNISQ